MLRLDLPYGKETAPPPLDDMNLSSRSIGRAPAARPESAGSGSLTRTGKARQLGRMAAAADARQRRQSSPRLNRRETAAPEPSPQRGSHPDLPIFDPFADAGAIGEWRRVPVDAAPRAARRAVAAPRLGSSARRSGRPEQPAPAASAAGRPLDESTADFLTLALAKPAPMAMRAPAEPEVEEDDDELDQPSGEAGNEAYAI